MLYVSRYVGPDKYGVVDTDDGKEEVVSADTLRKAVGSGLVVKGVLDNEKGVVPYQLLETVSAKQAKLLSLCGVVVRKFGDMITYVTVNSSYHAGTKIRLSDFGSSCGDMIFDERSKHMSPKLDVILDDKIAISGDTFRNLVRANIYVDVREVTKQVVINNVYEFWLSHSGMAPSTWYIQDFKWRRDCFDAVKIVRDGLGGRAFSQKALDFCAKYYEKTFCYASNYEFQLDAFEQDSLYGKVVNMLSDRPFWRSRCQDFDVVFERDKLEIFDTLIGYHLVKGGMGQRHSALKWFQNYLENFTPTDKIAMYYVRLCNNAYNWLFDLGERMGWFV